MEIESLVDFARRHIQEWIVTGRLKPGERIKEEEISARLGISRPPIREAFKVLEADGFVHKKPRSGVFVTEVTETDVVEVFTLQAALSRLSANLAAEAGTPALFREVEGALRRMETAARKDPPDIPRYQVAHRQYHDAILAAGGNGRLRRIAETLHLQSDRFGLQEPPDREWLEAALTDHREILAAIREVRREAGDLMERHVLRALEIMKRQFSRDNEMAVKGGADANPLRAVRKKIKGGAA